jgi:hypothetical protein
MAQLNVKVSVATAFIRIGDVSLCHHLVAKNDGVCFVDPANESPALIKPLIQN